MDNGQDTNREDDLFAEANRWFFRLQADDVTAAEKQNFSAWLNEDPAHAKAWRSVHSLMDSLRAPAQASYESRLGRTRGRSVQGLDLAVPRAAGNRRTAVAIAGCLLMIVGLTAYMQGPEIIDRWRADYVTTNGERQTITLADGTRVDLDADTALKTNLSAAERRVTVLHGNAFFEIAKDTRPFVVSTRDGDSRDIGTAFSVTKQEAMSTVTVAEGIVDVTAAVQPDATARVTAGEAIDYSSGGLSPLRVADLERDLAWRRGQIIFRQERLTDVVAKLNRYRVGRIVIVNPWIGDEFVSGTFSIDKPDAPIEALEVVLGIKAVSLSPYLIALH